MGTLEGFNYNPPISQQFIGGQVYAGMTGPSFTRCGSGAVDRPCFSPASFTAPPNFAVGRRNQYYGPNFFNTDVTVMKNFPLPRLESGKFGVGATFFNVLNHPNFDQPNADITNPQFGLITRDVSPPTSLFGAFLGGNASPRAIQLNARITF